MGDSQRFKDLSESIATSRYCEDQERLMDSLRQWTFDSAFQISDNFVDAEKDAERIQRIINFVNTAKSMLRMTSLLGKQTEERTKDMQFLALFTTPEDIIEMGRVLKKHMDEQARIMNESKVTPKTGGRRGIGASTLMSGNSAGYFLRRLKGRERGSASSTPAKDEMAPQGSSTPDLKFGQIKGKRRKHLKERQGKKMAALRLEEEVRKRPTTMEKVVVTESEAESDEESGKASLLAGEKTRNHMTLNDLKKEGVIVDEDVMMQKLTEERQRLKEETEATERQEEEERLQLEELNRKEEEEEKARKADLARLQKKKEEKEASDAKSRELRKEIAALEKRTKDTQKKREESKNRVEERKLEARKKEEAEKRRIIERSRKEAERKKEEEEEEEEKEEEEEEEGKPWVPVVKKKKIRSTDCKESPEKTRESSDPQQM